MAGEKNVPFLEVQEPLPAHPTLLFGATPARKKGISKFFAENRQYTYTLKITKKPLNYRNLSKNRQIFEKKDPKIFSPAAVFFN